MKESDTPKSTQPTSKRLQGQTVPPEIRTRGLQMARDGRKTHEICRTLGVSSSTVHRWRQAVAKPAPVGRPKGRKNAPSSPMGYFADQLAEMTKLIRTAMPNLARFALITTPDGKASIEYTVRQLSEVSGKVVL